MPKSETVVTVGSPSELLAALPHMLGYVPTDSLVLVCMHGGKKRTGLLLRYDDWVADYPEDFFARAIPRIEHEAPDSLLVVMFGERSPIDGDLPDRAFTELLVDELDQLGLDELDVLYTAEGRWWSYLCEDPRCCPPEGTPVTIGSDAELLLAAEHAYAGTAVLPDRRSLVRSLSFTDTDALTRRRIELEEAIKRTVAFSPESARRLAHRSVLDILERLADPRERLTDDEVAELVGLVEHLWGRDEFLVHGIDPDEREILIRVMSDVVRRVPPPYDAPVCSILAWLTYARGDGTLANIAVDRALATDPDYSLAQLVRSGLDQQIPPSLVQEAMAGAAEDLHGRSKGG
jgi:hypothetical protein